MFLGQSTRLSHIASHIPGRIRDCGLSLTKS
jgi:hypothetical protein